MFVNDLTPGTKVSIEASNSDAKVNLKTAVANISDAADVERVNAIKKENPSVKFVIVDAIREQDLLINFNADGVTNSLVWILNDKPQIWSGVAIRNVKLPVYGSVHLIVSKKEAVSYNRRQNFRVFMGVEGTVKKTETDEPKSVTVKDISESGIAFLIKAENEYQKGDILHISFIAGANATNFNLAIVVIRKESLPDGRLLYGCRLKNRSELVAKLVNQRQHEQMKASK
jgi:hypothetical protein